MGFSYSTTCFYQFVFDQDESNNTNIIQYFVMNRLGLFVKLNRYVSQMLYAWSFSHDTEVPIAVNQKICYHYLNAYSTGFS